MISSDGEPIHLDQRWCTALMLEQVPGRRPVRKAVSRATDELVSSSEHPPASDPRRSERSKKLQEKIDIHAVLFEQAWQVERR